MEKLQRDFVDKLDVLTAGIIATLIQESKSTSAFLAREVVDLLSEFTQRNGRIISSVDNIKKSLSFQNKLKQLVKKSGFGSEVRFIVAEYGVIASVINKYIGSIVPFQKKDLYTQVLKSNIQTTLDILVDTGLNTNFIQPVTLLLRKNIAGSTSIDELKTLLRAQIQGTEETLGLLDRYVTQTATDSVEQFGRNYIETISQDLNLQYFLFAGTKVKDTRSFCASRKGKYFTKDEIRSWASQEWAGKNKATTPDNILTLLGGYGCLDKCIPVSKEIYDKYK